MSVCTGGRLSYQYWLNGYIRHWVYAYVLVVEQQLNHIAERASTLQITDHQPVIIQVFCREERHESGAWSESTTWTFQLPRLLRG